MSNVATARVPPAPASVDALLVAALITVVPLTPHLPTWLIAVYVGAIAWRYAARYGIRQPGRALRWMLTVVGVVLVMRHYGTLFGRDAGVALLVWLTGLKLLELRLLRDAMLSAFLFLLIMLGGFLYDTSLLVGVYSLAALVSVIAAMARVQQSTLSWLDTYGFAATLMAQALPVMLVAYMLFPRLPGALWGVPTTGGLAETGIPEQLRPGSITSLIPSYEIAFRAQFDGVRPPARELYWRVRVYWDTDGRAWTVGASLPSDERVRPTGERVTYRLVLEPSEERWLPVLDLPVALPKEARQRAGFVYEQGYRRRERQTLEFSSVTRYQTTEPGGTDRVRTLGLYGPVSARVRDLANRLRAGNKSDGDVVRATLMYFREQPFFYTLTPPPLSDDPIDEFLFETRRGFCEHYATAFATLMRAAGIPSRVVAGYQGGLYNPSGNYVIVRQADAHAWTEVWLESSGWTRVDPTAAIAPARVEYGIEAVQRLNAQGASLSDVGGDAVRRMLQSAWAERAWLRLRLTWDYANISWYYWVNDFRRERQAQLLERLGITNWALAVMIFVPLQLVLLYLLFQARARRPRDVVRRLYDSYCAKLERAGITRAPDEGPLTLAERVRARRPDLAPSVDAITRLYVRLRYGRGAGRNELGALARAVRVFSTRHST
jgi:protein-glutamine gamma-glutamyltransferase